MKYLGTKGLQISLATKDKKRLLMIFIIVLFFMELGWRMMFEVMVGYFDMHDYLFKISNQSS